MMKPTNLTQTKRKSPSLAERRRRHVFRSAAVFALVTWAAPSAVMAQGSLEPPGAPAPTQKSLQEIWDEVADLKQQTDGSLSTLQAKVDDLANQVALLKADNEARQAAAAQQAPFWDHMATVMGAALPWDLSYVTDTAVDVGLPQEMDHSLAFAPDGQPAIAFYDIVDGATSAVKYASYDGSAWQISTIATGVVGTGRNPSLAFTPSGDPAVAFHGTSGAIHYLVRSENGAWQGSVLNAGADLLAPISLVFLTSGAPDGLPYIGYKTTTSAAAVYAYDGVSWAPQTSIDLARFIGLVINHENNLFLYANDLTEQQFVYRHKAPGGAWSAPISIASHGSVDIAVEDGSVALSRHYKTYIAGAADPYSAVRVYRSGGNEWSTYLVDRNVPLQTAPAIAISPGSGQPCLAYYDSDLGGIVFAAFDGNQWHRQVVTNYSPPNGSEISLAFTPDGRPAIVFHSGASIFYATRRHLNTQ